MDVNANASARRNLSPRGKRSRAQSDLTNTNGAALITSPVDLTQVDLVLTGLQSNADQDNLAACLIEKERDLEIAAHLGKALLEQNAQLNKQTDTLQTEYNAKLETLEQEKHELRRRLEAVEAEYESRVLELQTDVTALRSELGTQQTSARCSNRDKSALVDELAAQNEKLSQQVQQATTSEAQLSRQLTSLREQFNSRRVALHDHLEQLEKLQGEIQSLTQSKNDLQTKIESLAMERDELRSDLSDVRDQAKLLENESTEAKSQLQNADRELQAVRQENQSLRYQIEELQLFNEAGVPSHRGHSSSGPDEPQSLFNELEMCDVAGPSDDIGSPFCGSSQQHGQLQAADFTFRPSDMIEDDFEDNIECDEDFMPSELLHNDVNVQDMQFYARIHNDQDTEDTFHLKQEVLKVYKQLRTMTRPGDLVYDIIGGDTDHSQALLQASTISSDLLEVVLAELKGLMEDIVSREIAMVKRVKEAEAAKQYSDHQATAVSAHLDAVKEQLRFCKQRLADMSLQMDQQDSEMRKKSSELGSLHAKMAQQRVELDQMIEERQRLRADRALLLSSEPTSVAAKAVELRDATEEKKNAVEMELTKAQIDLMNLDDQLMDAIQQKLSLAQQIEQYQQHYGLTPRQ